MLDLDYFKAVNDIYGHDAGDQVLVETAIRLKKCVRTSDIISRLGGDEFLIALVNCAPPEFARKIAKDIVAAISEPILLNTGAPVQVGVSIGVVIDDSSGQTLKGLLKAADQALYQVKGQGRNGFAMILADGTIEAETICVDHGKR